jgi:predicted RNA-binding protein YlqC (UPF0109 family)
MNKLLTKYIAPIVKKPKKVNIKPVKIDFEVPSKVVGI